MVDICLQTVVPGRWSRSVSRRNRRASVAHSGQTDAPWPCAPGLKRSDAQRARRSLASLILVGPSGTQLAHTESGWVCGMCMHSLHASSLIARPMNNVNYHFASLHAVSFTIVDRSPPPQYKSNTGQRDNQDASLMMRSGVDDGRARRRYGLVVSHDHY